MFIEYLHVYVSIENIEMNWVDSPEIIMSSLISVWAQ